VVVLLGERHVPSRQSLSSKQADPILPSSQIPSVPLVLSAHKPLVQSTSLKHIERSSPETQMPS
jgi:hypothetical protein